MNAQISTHLSQEVHCPGRWSHNSSETSDLWRSSVQVSWYHSSSAKLVCGASGSHHRFPHNILVWPHQRCWTTTARCWLNSQYKRTFWVRFFVDGWTVRMLCWIWNWQFFWLTDTYIGLYWQGAQEIEWTLVLLYMNTPHELCSQLWFVYIIK